MPFKSRAQMRRFGAMLSRGEISQETFDEWAHATDTKRLPERVGMRARPARKKKGLRAKGKVHRRGRDSAATRRA